MKSTMQGVTGWVILRNKLARLLRQSCRLSYVAKNISGDGRRGAVVCHDMGLEYSA
jgi:hypothetical protein